MHDGYSRFNSGRASGRQDKEGTMRKRTPATQQLEFVRDLPRKGNQFGKWMEILQPLVKKPGHWALIHTCESPLQANKLQSNLHARMVIIPEPQHDWQFAARGSE